MRKNDVPVLTFPHLLFWKVRRELVKESIIVMEDVNLQCVVSGCMECLLVYITIILWERYERNGKEFGGKQTTKE